MPGFSKCCAGIGDSGSSNTRGGAARKAANFSAALFAEDLPADFFAAPFFADFFAPCLFDFVAINSPCSRTHTYTKVFSGEVKLKGIWNERNYRRAAARISSRTIKFLSLRH